MRLASSTAAAWLIELVWLLVLVDLARCYPGIRFRMIEAQDCIRRCIRIFVNCERVAGLDEAFATGNEAQILQALSGG